MKQTIDSITEWLKQAAADVGEPAYALIEGHRYTGFARWRNDGFELPGEPKEWLPLSWDVRVFGNGTAKWHEWHAWHESDGWFGRRYPYQEEHMNEHMKVLPRGFPLFGTSVRESDGWWKCSEIRGIDVWIPFPIEATDLPAMIDTELIAMPDEETGLMGICDMAIRRLRPSGGERK